MFFFSCLFSDFQKLEREARICRKLQHPNIGEYIQLGQVTPISKVKWLKQNCLVTDMGIWFGCHETLPERLGVIRETFIGCNFYFALEDGGPCTFVYEKKRCVLTALKSKVYLE